MIKIAAFELHRDNPKKYSICENTKGIMFYSVPHKGSALADVTLPLLRRSIELVEIQRSKLDLRSAILLFIQLIHLLKHNFLIFNHLILNLYLQIVNLFSTCIKDFYNFAKKVI